MITKFNKLFFATMAVLNSNFHKTNPEFITNEKCWTGQLKPVVPSVAVESSQL